MAGGDGGVHPRRIIVIPVEYMFIDFIAPPHLKGSLRGTEPLQVTCGALATPPLMFVMLIVAALLSLAVFLGHRLWNNAAATAEDAR